MPKEKRKTCVARDPLVYGSRECTKPCDETSDLCVEHRRLIAPHQLIRGTFYVADEADDG